MTQQIRTGGFAGLLFAAVLMLAGLPCLPASAAEPTTQTSVFKGHQLTASIDGLTHRATVELDHRQILAKDDIAEVAKINPIDIGTSFVYLFRVKSTTGCGSYVIIRISLLVDNKNEVLSDFGACNDLVMSTLEFRPGSAASSSWFAVGYRDDRATAQVALIRDDKLTTHEVNAPPCLFAPIRKMDCLESVLADAYGTGELGVPTGSGTFGDQKIVTYLNRKTGKATLKLNDQVLRTFDNAREFYLASTDGEDQFGLFALYLKPATGCSTRPLVFFAKRGSEPTIIADYAPCSDRMTRLSRKKGETIEWSGVAFHFGEPNGYIATVTDHKLSTRTTLLPACMMDAEGSKASTCTLQALGQPAPSTTTLPPRLTTPPPSAARKTPRSTLGI